VAGLVEGLVLGAGVGVAYAVEGWTHAALGEARAEQIAGALFIAFLGLTSAGGVVHDLARAAVIRFRVTGLRALGLGARTFRRSPVSLWWSWAWRMLASVAPVLTGAAVAERLGGRGGVALVVLFALHQCVVVVHVGLRASWLAKALRAVDVALRRTG
jgi:hypothetical protein